MTAYAVALGWVAFALALGYLAASYVIRWGTLRRPGPLAEARPTISVVVAARDERENIGACLESLRKQVYPDDRWELVVVDDRSTDGTGDAVRRFAADWPKVRIARVDAKPDMIGGKQNALAIGIDGTAGEIVAMTDADCTVPPVWLAQIAGAFADEVGVVAGLSTLPPASGKFAAAELDQLMAVQWGTIGLGFPITARGNNLAVRRAAYDEIGGYRALGPTIAEDAALVARIAQRTAWRIAMAPPSASVVTAPPRDLRAFLRQRLRWASAARDLGPSRTMFLAAVWLQRAVLLAATAVWICGPLSGFLPASAWLATTLGDVHLIARVARAHGHSHVLPWGPVVTVWQVVYQTYVGIRAGLFPWRREW